MSIYYKTIIFSFVVIRMLYVNVLKWILWNSREISIFVPTKI